MSGSFFVPAICYQYNPVKALPIMQGAELLSRVWKFEESWQDMKTSALSRKHTGCLHAVTLALLTYSLVGCAVPVSPQPKAVPSSNGVRSVIQAQSRAIISFQRPTVNSSQLSEAIEEACHCQPVFIRQYRDNALIYGIALPQDHSFAAFEKLLRLKATLLGIKAIEQDTLEHF